MKVLIIGAKGMLGGMLMKVLAPLETEATTGGLSLTGFDREEIDITDAELVKEKISSLKPDIIINAAAWTAVDAAEDSANREAVFAVNESGVRNLAEVAKETGAKLVHYSTDYVFSGDNPEGYTEADTPGPAVNVYGESKLAGETALIDSGADFYLVRTSWLYGPGGKNFVDTMLKLGQERDELRVINDQHGSPTFTKDVAEFTKTLLEEKYEPGIYHAVNIGQTTWYDFAKKIFELAGIEVQVEPIQSAEYPVAAKRPAYSVLKNTKGPTMREWEEALRDYLDNL